MTDEDVVAQHHLGSEGVRRDELGRAERAGLQKHSILHLPDGSGDDPPTLLDSHLFAFELEPGPGGGGPNQAQAPATDIMVNA